MANPTKVIGGATYLKCKECCEYKKLGNKSRYKHYQGYLGVLGRCKSCIKKGRKTDRELAMARKRDTDRYYNNPKRREYIFTQAKINRKQKGYGKIHAACYRIIKKLGIRPKDCPICDKQNTRIEAHHYNYQHPFKIIFCCSVCHSKLDRGIIDYKKCNIIDIEPKHYKSKVKGIDHKINTTGSVF